MSTLDEIKDKLDKLAGTMLDEAAKAETSLDRKLDIFKFVQNYYVGAQKLNGKTSQPPGGDTPTMDALRNQVAAASSAPDPQEEEGTDDETDSR